MGLLRVLRSVIKYLAFAILGRAQLLKIYTVFSERSGL